MPFPRWPFALLLLAPPLLFAQQTGLEVDTNRAGHDFRDFEMETANAADCKAACVADESCRSFTYVKPGVQGKRAHCWLKSTVPPATPDKNCVSGVVERAAPKHGDLEQGTNRAGMDYRDFVMSAAKPEDCRAACNAEAPCESFTYVKPGVQGPQAHCWLKSDVPPATPDANCVSGVRVGPAPSGGCPCVATTCAAACKDAMVLLCVAGGTTKNDGVACQQCINANCPP